jgi:hypothetical protein
MLSKLMRGLMVMLLLCQAATAVSGCSTTGGMYSESDPQNNEFSGWKTAGAVLLGIVTLGAIGAGAYAGATSHPAYTYQPNVTYVGGNSHVRTYIVNGEYVTCYRTGNYVNCY